MRQRLTENRSAIDNRRKIRNQLSPAFACFSPDQLPEEVRVTAGDVGLIGPCPA